MAISKRVSENLERMASGVDILKEIRTRKMGDEAWEEAERILAEDKARREKKQFRKIKQPTRETNRPAWARKPQPKVPKWSIQKDEESRKYGQKRGRPAWAKEPKEVKDR